MSKVYIAGPMRGYQQLNFAAFDAAKQKAIEKGFEPTSPADMDRDVGMVFESLTVQQSTAEQCRSAVSRDVAALLAFRSEDGDAVAVLPGWEHSIGATAEVAIARWLKLQILDARTFDPLDWNTCFTTK